MCKLLLKRYHHCWLIITQKQVLALVPLLAQLVPLAPLIAQFRPTVLEWRHPKPHADPQVPLMLIRQFLKGTVAVISR